MKTTATMFDKSTDTKSQRFINTLYFVESAEDLRKVFNGKSEINLNNFKPVTDMYKSERKEFSLQISQLILKGFCKEISTADLHVLYIK